MNHIGSRVKNLYALEVEDACKALRSKEVVNDLVVEREKLSLNMQPHKQSQKFVEQPQLEMQRGTEWKSPLKQRPPGGGNFEREGKREYMQLYL